MTEIDVAPIAPAAITILSGNLLSGGIGRSRREERFAQLMAVAARQRPDIYAAQEALYWDEQGGRLLREAEERLGMTGVLGISPRTGMHTALFVRAPLRIVEHRVDHGGIWHHSVTHALVAWDEQDGIPAGRLRVASVHLSPRNPARRLLEAGELTDYGTVSEAALLLGDTNTEDEYTDLAGAPPQVLVRFARLGTDVPDTAPIDLLCSAGLWDLAPPAAHGGPPVRTTGHWPGKPVAGRPDRALANSAAVHAFSDYAVITEARDLTDHDWLRLSLRRAALAI